MIGSNSGVSTDALSAGAGWAIASGAWLATGWVIGIVLFASALSAVTPSGCQGGIDQAVPPSYESSDGQHWVGRGTASPLSLWAPGDQRPRFMITETCRPRDGEFPQHGKLSA